MRPLVAFTLCAMSLAITADVAAEDGPNDRHHAARTGLASQLAACEANFDALSTFDVLIRTDIVRDSVYGHGYTETVFERLILDHDENRCLYSKRGHRQRFNGQTIESIRTGFISDGRSARTVSGKQVAEPAEVQNGFQALLDRFSVPNIKLTPFVRLGQDSKSIWKDNQDNCYTTFPREAESVRLVSTAPLEYAMQFENRVGYLFRFDDTTLMPSKTTWRVATEPGFRTLGTGVYGWKDFDGLYLPISVLGEYHEPEFPADAERTEENIRNLLKVVTFQRDVQFVWVSVNQPLPESQFDLSLADSRNRFFALTDPLEQGLPMINTHVERE